MTEYKNTSTDFSDIKESLIPTGDNTQTLGTPQNRWKSLDLGPNSLNMTDDEGTTVTLSTLGGSLLVEGADIIRVGNMNFTATGIESATSSQDITIGNPGDTGYLSTARGVKFPDETVQTTAAIGVGIGPETSFVVTGGTTGTQPTFNGAPLFSGSYVIQGPVVHFQIQVSFSNITSFGTGQYYMDLPLPAKYGYQVTAGCVHDISEGKDYLVSGHVFAGTSRMLLKSVDATGNSVFDVPFTKTSPFTLAVADNFHISGDYIYTDG